MTATEQIARLAQETLTWLNAQLFQTKGFKQLYDDDADYVGYATETLNNCIHALSAKDSPAEVEARCVDLLDLFSTAGEDIDDQSDDYEVLFNYLGLNFTHSLNKGIDRSPFD